MGTEPCCCALTAWGGYFQVLSLAEHPFPDPSTCSPFPASSRSSLGPSGEEEEMPPPFLPAMRGEDAPTLEQKCSVPQCFHYSSY